MQQLHRARFQTHPEMQCPLARLQIHLKIQCPLKMKQLNRHQD